MPNRSVQASHDCRIVVIYRIDAERAQLALPAGLALRTVNGSAFGGIALRCGTALPSSAFFPTRFVRCARVFHFVGAIRSRRHCSETAAVVVRYDTSSRWKALADGEWRWSCRGHHARIRIVHSPDSIGIRCESDDRVMRVAIDAQPRQELRGPSVFRSKQQFMQMVLEDLVFLRLNRRHGRRRSSTRTLCSSQLIPLHVKYIESTVFSDSQRFPDGAAEFDSAYWLRDDEVVWSEEGLVCCDMATA